MKLLAVILIICVVLTLQTAPNSGVLEPPRKGLVALHWPDLSRLEANVREQIQEAQTSLAVKAKNPATSVVELSEIYGYVGQIYHAYSLTAPARECYLNASRLEPKYFRWIYLLGKLDQQEGRFEDAVRSFRAVKALEPGYIAVVVNLGNIFLELDQLPEAYESFNAALAIDGNDPAAHYGLGQIAVSRRNYAQAVKHFEKTLERVPGATRVHYALAMAYRGLGNAEKVKAHLAQQGTVGVRVSDPVFDGLQDLIEGERVFLARGKLAFEAQRYADAVVEFRKAVAAKPDSVTARVNLGATLSQTGDLAGAAEQFEAAIRIDPHNTNAHYNLAVILARQNKHDEALVEFSRVVTADPNDEGALLEQVKLLHRTGKFKQALAAVEKGHAQYPQKGRTIVMLAYLLVASPEFQLRDGARALDLAQRVYKASGAPQHGALVAMALAELGRCNEAVELRRKVLVALDKQGNTDFKSDEGGKSCRPPGDKTLAGLP